MNLEQTPVEGIIAWVLENKAKAAEYLSSVFQLSHLTTIFSFDGEERTTLVTFSGKNAELNIDLSWISLGVNLMLPELTKNTTESPYSSESEASAAMLAQVVSCLVAVPEGADISAMSASAGGGTLTVTDTIDNRLIEFSTPINLTGGEVMQVTYSFGGTQNSLTGPAATLYSYDGTLIESQTSPDPGNCTLSFTVPDSGWYILSTNATNDTTSIGVTVIVSGSGMTVGAIGAAWNDGENSGIVRCS